MPQSRSHVRRAAPTREPGRPRRRRRPDQTVAPAMPEPAEHHERRRSTSVPAPAPARLVAGEERDAGHVDAHADRDQPSGAAPAGPPAAVMPSSQLSARQRAHHRRAEGRGLCMAVVESRSRRSARPRRTRATAACRDERRGAGRDGCRSPSAGCPTAAAAPTAIRPLGSGRSGRSARSSRHVEDVVEHHAGRVEPERRERPPTSRRPAASRSLGPATRSDTRPARRPRPSHGSAAAGAAARRAGCQAELVRRGWVRRWHAGRGGVPAGARGRRGPPRRAGRGRDRARP